MENYKRKSSVSWKDLGDHIIILDSGEGKMVHHLEDVSSYLWKLLEDEQTIDSLSNKVITEFDTSFDQAKSDITEFIANLQKNSLLE
jgi:hypothetical protein